MFIVLLGGDKQFANQLCSLFSEYLDNGYTYQDIRTEILSTFYNKKKVFRWNIFQNEKRDSDSKNLLVNGTRYYHRQLKIVNNPTTVEHDIDKGTIVSRTSEYFLEPVASYTTQEFIQYFYKIMPIDLQASPPSHMHGILKYKIKQYGIDKLLFMTDICAQTCRENNTVFSLPRWDEYSPLADEKLDMIKGAFADAQSYYTIKQRRLFDESA
jgi:hypothetical protein